MSQVTAVLTDLIITSISDSYIVELMPSAEVARQSMGYWTFLSGKMFPREGFGVRSHVNDFNARCRSGPADPGNEIGGTRACSTYYGTGIGGFRNITP